MPWRQGVHLRAFIVPEFGQPGEVGERPIPTPGEGQILVRVRAASVNPMDVVVRSGMAKDFLEHRFPLTPGSDYAGTVEAVGPSVSGFEIGDEVFGAVGKPYYGEGTFAEYVTVNAGLAAIRPADLTPERAASLPLAAGAALALVDALDAKSGDTIAVIGAAGGVGSVAIQLAAERGLRVIAVTKPEHADYVRSLGAADVIDYTSADVVAELKQIAPDGLAGIIDTFHGAQDLLPFASTVKPGGVIASPMAMGADQVFAGQPVTAKVVRAALDRAAELGQLAVAGKLTGRVEIVPFADAAAALDRQATRQVSGKLVLSIAKAA